MKLHRGASFRPFAPAGLLALALSAPLVAQAQAPGTWTSAPDMSIGRYSPATVRLPDNRVLVAGGHYGPGETIGAQIYNPTTAVWATAGSLRRARDFPVAMLVDEDRNGTDETALVFGGYNSTYGTLNTVERYAASANTFSYLTYKSGSKTYQSNMLHARELFTATRLPDGRLLLVGGFKTFNWAAPAGTLKSAEIYDPYTKRFTATGSMSSTGTPYGRFGHDAILLPRDPANPADLGRVLIVGGKERRSNSDWRSLRSIEIYDVAAGTFTYVGEMVHRRDRVTLAWVEAEKKVLIVGGKSEAPGEPMHDVLQAEWFDPATNSVSFGPMLSQGRMGHTLTPLSDGGFLVVGGWSESRA
ncbi:MAG TPA: hypothetical protein VK689_18520, partial [Armatimonadota bacterium]|nr:hypothetical protein [Armatimonadota bacterium]